MPALSIFMDAEGMLEGIPDDKIIHVTDTIKVGALPRGMTSGKASVSFGIPLPDGRTVLAETSMALFLSAARAFATKYGEEGIIE